MLSTFLLFELNFQEFNSRARIDVITLKTARLTPFALKGLLNGEMIVRPIYCMFCQSVTSFVSSFTQ